MTAAELVIDLDKTVPTPSYDLGQWYFNSVIASTDGCVYSLWITPPDGKTASDVPIGFKIKSGDGTQASPCVFELVYAAAASTVSFGKVTSADQITAENIEVCTFDDAKAWVLDNWDDAHNSENYVVLAYSDGTNICAVYIDSGMTKEQFDQITTSTHTTTIADLKTFFSSYSADIYLCGFEAPATAYAGYVPAETDDTNALVAKVVKFNGYDWYLIEDNSTAADAGTVTLLAKDMSFGTSAFDENYMTIRYVNSTVRAALLNLTADSGSFAAASDAITATDLTDIELTGEKLWLLSADQVDNLPTAVKTLNSNWWIRTPGTNGPTGTKAKCVDTTGSIGESYVDNSLGVRPALTLDLSKVEFDSETNTFALPAAHEHDFSYSKKDVATITATCWADGCTLTDSKVTLTIVAPTLTVYGGTGSEAATLDGLDAFNEATELAISADSIKYYNATKEGTDYTKTGDALATAPTNAGDYVAEIMLPVSTAKIAGTPIRVGYTIAKADPSYTVPTDLSATYGDTLADVTLPEGFAWADDTATSVGAVGANTFKAIFTPTDTANYNTVSDIDVTVTVNHIPGDINGDGEVNNKDLSRLFQYLSDWEVDVDVTALDVNGDGKVNNKDLTRLFQYLSNWDVEIF